MNLSELIQEVRVIVDDDSFTDDEITTYLNMCLLRVSYECDIPDFKRVAVISTSSSQSYVDLSSLSGGFSGRLTRVNDVNYNYDPVEIYPNLEAFIDAYPDLTNTGRIEAVALEGSILWYQKLEATSLRLIYYKNPTTLVNLTDEVESCFPEYIQLYLLAHGTAYILYDKIEDGIESEKTNTNAQFWLSFNRKNKDSGIHQFLRILAKQRRHHITGIWRY